MFISHRWQAGLLALAALLGVGAAGWKLGWWEALTGGREQKGQSKPKETPLEQLRRLLAPKDEAQWEAMKEELARALGDKAWEKDEETVKFLVKDLSNGGGIDPFLLLDKKKKEKKALKTLIPQGKRISRTDARDVRDYLHLWRKHLRALREEARNAGLGCYHAKEAKVRDGKDPAKLKDYPALALLARLASDREEYGSLAPAVEAPVLPWLTSDDESLVSAVSLLLLQEKETRDFITKANYLGLPGTPSPTLGEVFAKFHEREVHKRLPGRFGVECRDAARGGLIPEKHRLLRAFDGLSDDLTDRKGPPNLLRPDKPRKGALLAPGRDCALVLQEDAPLAAPLWGPSLLPGEGKRGR